MQLTSYEKSSQGREQMAMSSRVAWSGLLIVLSVWPHFFGWLFLWSGIGIIYIAFGLLMVAVGMALAWSWRTVAYAFLALLAGSGYLLVLLVDIYIMDLPLG